MTIDLGFYIPRSGICLLDLEVFPLGWGWFLAPFNGYRFRSACHCCPGKLSLSLSTWFSCLIYVHGFVCVCEIVSVFNLCRLWADMWMALIKGYIFMLMYIMCACTCIYTFAFMYMLMNMCVFGIRLMPPPGHICQFIHYCTIHIRSV